MHPGSIKQPVLIAHGLCLRLDAKSGAIHKQDRDQQGSHDCYDADPVNILTRAHRLNPYNRRCS